MYLHNFKYNFNKNNLIIYYLINITEHTLRNVNNKQNILLHTHQII